MLLALFKEEKLHLFCSGRTLGHAAINQFNEGHERLDMGKLDDFICKSTAYADVIGEMWAYKQAEKDSEADQPQPGHPGFEALSPHINDNSDNINISASEPTSSDANGPPGSPMARLRHLGRWKWLWAALSSSGLAKPIKNAKVVGSPS
jgi:hypothetical protein